MDEVRSYRMELMAGSEARESDGDAWSGVCSSDLRDMYLHRLQNVLQVIEIPWISLSLHLLVT